MAEERIEVGVLARDVSVQVATQVANTVAAAKTNELLAASASAEASRVSAEQGRVTAEQGRVTAEQGRVAAETARATEFAGFEDEIAAKLSKGDYDATTGVGYADNADQLNSPDFTTDQAPYLFRTSGGDADIGNREKDTIVGGSLGWNQLVQNGNFVDTSNWNYIGGTGGGTLSASDNILTLSISNTNGIIQTKYGKLAGHKYFCCYDIKTDFEGKTRILWSGGGEDWLLGSASKTIAADTWHHFEGIYGMTSNSPSSGSLYLYCFNENRTSGTAQYKNVMLIDLTACFGSIIADYIYSLETATAGAGVAWFRKYFPKPYYPYKAIGGFLHVKLTSHDMVGFNQWAGNDVNSPQYKGHYVQNGASSSYSITANNNYNLYEIDAIPNAVYYFGKHDGAQFYGAGIIAFLDANGDVISGTEAGYNVTHFTATAPANCAKIRFSVGTSLSSSSICINLSWSGWRNGQYEAYKKNSYPLDTSVILRGIPKLDADNNLYFDGDKYHNNGSVEENFAVGTPSSVGITSNSSYSNENVSAFNFRKFNGAADKGYYAQYASCVTYPMHNYDNTINYICGDASTTQYVIMLPAGTTLEQATQIITNLSILYKLATPTTSQADPFQETQEVDDFGTEEYVVPEQDGVSVPVGHYTEYPENLRDKLRRLPNMPTVSESTTATYAVNYNGQTKKCSFVPINDWLVANGYPVVQDLSASGLTAASGITLKFPRLKKIGSIVFIDFVIQNTSGSAISANTKVLTIDSSCAPSTTNYGVFNGVNQGFEIKSNGDITTLKEISAGAYAEYHGCFQK